MTIWDTWNQLPGWDQVQKTQKYLTATPLFQQHVHDILFKYGVDPGNQADMAGTSVDFTNDPYSIVNLLKNTATGQTHDAMNAANNAGLEESGAAAGALNAVNEDYKKAYSGAMSNLSSELTNEFGSYKDTIGGIFDDLEQAPAPAAAPPADTAPAAPSNIYGDDAFGRAAARGPSAPPPSVGNPWHVPDTNGDALTVANQLKKTKLPVVGGRGHVT